MDAQRQHDGRGQARKSSQPFCGKGAELKSTSSPSLGEQKAWRSRPISETRCGEELKRNESERCGDGSTVRSAPAPTSTAGRVGDAWRGRGGAARGRMRDARAKRLYTRRYRVRKPVQRRRNVPRRITWRKTDPGSPLWRPARAPLTDTRRMPERCGIRARNPRGLCIKPEPCRPGPAQLPPGPTRTRGHRAIDYGCGRGDVRFL